MSKREKIIVSLMAATVLLGGYLYLLPGTTDNQRAVEMQLDASTTEFVHKVIQKFKQDTTLAVELFAIRSAERKWEKDPFLDSHAQLSDTPQRRVFEKTPATDDARLNLVYAGYVEVGSRVWPLSTAWNTQPGRRSMIRATTSGVSSRIGLKSASTMRRM
jgi:hypothetical protein